MTKPTSQPDCPIEAVLEPIAPSSLYNFVEIESNPIQLKSPLANLSGFLTRSLSLLKTCVQVHWKIAIGVLFMLIGAELALRVYEPRLVGRVYSRTFTGGHPIEMNSQGFRGDPVSIPKPENTTRILALGDSVTFGTGLNWRTTWPAQLEDALIAASPQNQTIEVINTALPALDLDQINIELIHRWKRFDADRAVLLVTGNMVSFAYARRDQRVTEEFNPKKRLPTPADGTPSLKDRALNIYFSFALPGALTIGMEHLKYAVGLENHSMNPGYPTGVMLAHGYTQNGIDEQLIEESWAIFKGQLASLSHTLDELEIPLTVVYSPPRFMLSKSRVENLKWVDTDRFSIDPIDVTSKICQDLHITFIDPRDPLSQATKPVYILSDYTHFDASGNKAIAQVIAKTITNPN